MYTKCTYLTVILYIQKLPYEFTKYNPTFYSLEPEKKNSHLLKQQRSGNRGKVEENACNGLCPFKQIIGMNYLQYFFKYH
jgi:hypothetical protein